MVKWYQYILIQFNKFSLFKHLLHVIHSVTGSSPSRSYVKFMSGRFPEIYLICDRNYSECSDIRFSFRDQKKLLTPNCAWLGQPVFRILRLSAETVKLGAEWYWEAEEWFVAEKNPPSTLKLTTRDAPNPHHRYSHHS